MSKRKVDSTFSKVPEKKHKPEHSYQPFCDDIVEGGILPFLDVKDLIDTCRAVNKQFKHAADNLLLTNRYQKERKFLVTHTKLTYEGLCNSVSSWSHYCLGEQGDFKTFVKVMGIAPSSFHILTMSKMAKCTQVKYLKWSPYWIESTCETDSRFLRTEKWMKYNTMPSRTWLLEPVKQLKSGKHVVLSSKTKTTMNGSIIGFTNHPILNEHIDKRHLISLECYKEFEDIFTRHCYYPKKCAFLSCTCNFYSDH